MATVKVKFRASITGSEGTLFYQVIHNRVVRQINSSYKLHSSEWNASKAHIVFPDLQEEHRRRYLSQLQDAFCTDIRQLESIIRRLEIKGCAYTADDVVKAYLSQTTDYDFVSFARKLAYRLQVIGKKRTAETYTTAINSFERFLNGKEMLVNDIEADLMVAYESYLDDSGVCPNTISFYMRNLRSIYNRAVDKGLTEQQQPFKYVYTGIGKTIKRAVPLEVIRQIKCMELSLQPHADFARDIFMFSFYTRGMSFVDIAFLKKKDLKNGILSYRRHKTKRLLYIKWEKPMQEIIDKYDTVDTPYLLPLIKNNGKDEWTQYKNEEHKINRLLKGIGKQLGLSIPLTTYVARHGWASIAKSKNIPIATISEALGHDSEATTRIYLATLDTAAVDNANRSILQLL